MNKQLLKEKDYQICHERYQRDICIEVDVPFGGKSLEITLGDLNNDFVASSGNIEVKDKFIVGLGDSYASGEGNPDIPAQFALGKTDVDFFYIQKIKRMPQKDKDPKVGWLDRRCHRSMYSYQFKTALQLALSNPKEAVTFVTFACSGATTNNIIEEKQTSNEGGGKVPAQIDSLKKLLAVNKGKPRMIDYLLLSTGGNDIGFAKYVAYIVTSGSISGIVGKQSSEETESIIRETLLSGKGQKKGNYPKLHEAFLSQEGILIRDCEANKPCKRILLTAYPDILNDENGKLCEANRKEFDIPFKKEEKRGERIKMAKQFVFEPLQKVQKDKLINSDLGWTVVAKHFDAYIKHGFCAQNPLSKSLTGEKFVMPIRNNMKWEPFDPRDYRSYEKRQRWVRLPIDSKLTTDQVHIFWKFPLDLFFEDDRSNIMHPTAEGHSKTADANFETIMYLESKKPK